MSVFPYDLFLIDSNLPKEMSQIVRYRPRIEDNLGKSASAGQGSHCDTAAAALNGRGLWPDRIVSQHLGQVPPNYALGLCSAIFHSPFRSLFLHAAYSTPSVSAEACGKRGSLRWKCLGRALLLRLLPFLWNTDNGEVDHLKACPADASIIAFFYAFLCRRL